jgi:ABC-2 type transport system permease protein
VILLLIRFYRGWRARHPREAAVATATATGRVARASSAPSASAAARGSLALLAHQVRYDLLASTRNPRARFFTFFFPILLLVIFASVFGNGTTTVDGVTVKLSHFYVPGILAMSIITTAYGNLVVSVATARETGVLKRRRATPVPAVVLVLGQALATLAVAAVMSTILLVIARLGYGVGLSLGALAASACTLVVGTLAFACIGYAVASMAGSGSPQCSTIWPSRTRIMSSA